MIEVRSSYLIRTKDVKDAFGLWKEGRDKVWPVLGWSGRIQQMLHGHAQQSLFVWSSQWQNMADWEAGMAKTLDCQEYKAWSAEINKLRAYGEEREVFRILEPSEQPDNQPGRIEIRSSYIVPIINIKKIQESFKYSQEVVWKIMGWSGQNQQMLHGKASQSMFVWSSTWDNLGDYEKSMAKTMDCPEFQEWYKDFLTLPDFGGPREIFKNL